MSECCQIVKFKQAMVEDNHIPTTHRGRYRGKLGGPKPTPPPMIFISTFLVYVYNSTDDTVRARHASHKNDVTYF